MRTTFRRRKHLVLPLFRLKERERLFWWGVFFSLSFLCVGVRNFEICEESFEQIFLFLLLQLMMIMMMMMMILIRV